MLTALVKSGTDPILNLDLGPVLNGPAKDVVNGLVGIICGIVNVLIPNGLTAKVIAELGGQICVDALVELCYKCGKSINFNRFSIHPI